MGLAITMGFFFILVTMIFVAIAVFLPEWLGITGKKAKQIIKDQQAEEAREAAAIPESTPEFKENSGPKNETPS